MPTYVSKTYLGKPEVHVRQVTDLYLVCIHSISDLTIIKTSTSGSKYDHHHQSGWQISHIRPDVMVKVLMVML